MSNGIGVNCHTRMRIYLQGGFANYLKTAVMSYHILLYDLGVLFDYYPFVSSPNQDTKCEMLAYGKLELLVDKPLGFQMPASVEMFQNDCCRGMMDLIPPVFEEIWM